MFALPALAQAAASALFTSEATSKWINLALGIVMGGIDVANKMAALNAQIKSFVDANREPTPAEWDAMAARDAVADAKIEGAAASL